MATVVFNRRLNSRVHSWRSICVRKNWYMIVRRLSFNQYVLLVSHVIVACIESNHSAARPRKAEQKRAFLQSSYMVSMLFSFVASLLPNEKLIFFSKRKINTVGSSLESIPINFSDAKSGYATVFAIFYLTSWVAPNLFNSVLFAKQLSIQVALTWICSFVYQLIT